MEFTVILIRLMIMTLMTDLRRMWFVILFHNFGDRKSLGENSSTLGEHRCSVHWFSVKS